MESGKNLSWCCCVIEEVGSGERKRSGSHAEVR